MQSKSVCYHSLHWEVVLLRVVWRHAFNDIFDLINQFEKLEVLDYESNIQFCCNPQYQCPKSLRYFSLNFTPRYSDATFTVDFSKCQDSLDCLTFKGSTEIKTIGVKKFEKLKSLSLNFNTTLWTNFNSKIFPNLEILIVFELVFEIVKPIELISNLDQFIHLKKLQLSLQNNVIWVLNCLIKSKIFPSVKYFSLSYCFDSEEFSTTLKIFLGKYFLHL